MTQQSRDIGETLAPMVVGPETLVEQQLQLALGHVAAAEALALHYLQDDPNERILMLASDIIRRLEELQGAVEHVDEPIKVAEQVVVPLHSETSDQAIPAQQSDTQPRDAPEAPQQEVRSENTSPEPEVVEVVGLDFDPEDSTPIDRHVTDELLMGEKERKRYIHMLENVFGKQDIADLQDDQLRRLFEAMLQHYRGLTITRISEQGKLDRCEQLRLQLAGKNNTEIAELYNSTRAAIWQGTQKVFEGIRMRTTADELAELVAKAKHVELPGGIQDSTDPAASPVEESATLEVGVMPLLPEQEGVSPPIPKFDADFMLTGRLRRHNLVTITNLDDINRWVDQLHPYGHRTPIMRINISTVTIEDKRFDMSEDQREVLNILLANLGRPLDHEAFYAQGFCSFVEGSTARRERLEAALRRFSNWHIGDEGDKLLVADEETKGVLLNTKLHFIDDHPEELDSVKKK